MTGFHKPLRHAALLALLSAWFGFTDRAYSLDPRKPLAQYSHTLWTPENGLPPDAIHALAQTTDGYLWLGTDEELARFDGYQFVAFSKARGELPASRVSALAASKDGSLWVGTEGGLTRYRDRKFTTFTVAEGLPDNSIRALCMGPDETLWIVAGTHLARYRQGRFETYKEGPAFPLSAVRAIVPDRQGGIWVAGTGGLARFSDGRFVQSPGDAGGDVQGADALLPDRRGNLWMGANTGLRERLPSGEFRNYRWSSGPETPAVRALAEDRDGNVWAATTNGLARVQNTALAASDVGRPRDSAQSVFEDREGNIWVAARTGLSRYREDDVFTSYSTQNGLPSDEANAIFQDSRGRVWVGFADAGLLLFSGEQRRMYTARDGLPDNEIFSIRETREGELLVGTSRGLGRLKGTAFSRYVPPGPTELQAVFDALEDSAGNLWLASASGLKRLRGQEAVDVISADLQVANTVVTLSEGRDGILWAGTRGNGLWRVRGSEKQHFDVGSGLSSNQIRSIYEDKDGTVWIGTLGGGLSAIVDGKFHRFTASDGLLSDNITKVVDDANGNLWLSTTRGVSRLPKRQLLDFARHKLDTLRPIVYGIEHGIRSAQCLPAQPACGGGFLTSDDRLWFTTSRGLGVFNLAAGRKQIKLGPAAHILDITADGRRLDLSGASRLPPGIKHVEISYTGIFLGAPERVRYSYKLDGVDSNWVAAGSRRVINYNDLGPGRYRFAVRTELPAAPSSEEAYSFEVQPHFYQAAWFRLFCLASLLGSCWAAYQMNLRRIHREFALILEERARMAREIHDTLAQGYVGISRQLNAVALYMPEEDTPARKYLEMARRMARHSLTEARRSVMDLRSAGLEGKDLASALESGTRLWTAGSGVETQVNVKAPEVALPEKTEHQLFRIAQEAVTNVVKHAGATCVWVGLRSENRELHLRIADNGSGFEQQGAFSSPAGHFGLIGMRERAHRLGGQLNLVSQPGQGTEVEVVIPIP